MSEQDFMERLLEGVAVVVAAGNDGYDLNSSNNVYPCEYTHANIVCVAALDQNYNIAAFSNQGTTSVDVGAPGTNILSGFFGDYIEVLTEDFSASTWDETYSVYFKRINLDNDDVWYITYPRNFNYSNTYPSNGFAVSSGTHNLSLFSNVVLSFDAYVDTEYGYDGVIVRSTINPDKSSGSIIVSALSGRISSPLTKIYYNFTADLSHCNNSSTCTVKYSFDADESNQYTGVAIKNYKILSADTSVTNKYEVLDGTSMAAPYVTGLAAMLLAYNPNFTYLDIVNALKFGGDIETSLSNKVSTGRSADAWGSMKYINAPSGVSVEQLN